MNTRGSIKKSKAWNQGLIVGQKRPLKLRDIWEIRIRLKIAGNSRNLALFNLALDSKLRGCDLIGLLVSGVASVGRVSSRATIVQSKTQKPVHFEITAQTRDSLATWIQEKHLKTGDWLFPSRTSPMVISRPGSTPELQILGSDRLGWIRGSMVPIR